jgi:hypothetical protein
MLAKVVKPLTTLIESNLIFVEGLNLIDKIVLANLPVN